MGRADEIDAGPDSIVGDSVVLGSISFEPAYVAGGSATKTTVKVKGSLAG